MGESVCNSICLRECCVYGSQSKTDRAVTVNIVMDLPKRIG